jgi:hypothetical protein|tara:strand:+ start:389 stop:571 length:183 start_codon:yes stop_codon:yes gene_type:complete
MNKSTIQNCIECFERFDVSAYEEDGSVFVETSMLDIFVEISEKEILWRADQYLEIQNQDA